MAIIVETGAVVAGANSYVDIAYANNYHTTYGNTDWDASGQNDYTTALIVAAQALDAYYAAKYESLIPVGSTQSLLWPRLVFWDRNQRIRQQGVIPDELKKAQCEFALLYSNGTDLFPQLNADSQIIETQVKVGEIATRTYYQKPTAVSNFRKVDLLLWPILKAGPSGTRLR